MRIRRHMEKENEDNVESLELKDDKFVKIEPYSYQIYLSPSEYRAILPAILEYHVTRAVIQGINVYYATTHGSKFILCGLDLTIAPDTIIAFETCDVNKHETLDTIVKNFVKAVTEATEKSQSKEK